MPGIDAMIAEAEKTLGMGEPNSIQSWYNSKFGAPEPGNWPWCDGAVTYWAHKSGNAKAVCFSDNGHYAYTVAHAEAFKSRGQWTYGTSGIRRGDIVFFDWNGADSIAAIDHVGLVTGVRADGKVETIEGNTSDVCARRVRGSLEIAGYGRPKYTGGSTPPSTGGGSVATVKLADAQAKTDAATRVIQDALNKEFGGVVVDGDFGPQTAAAYKRWQQKLGWPGDGKPSAHSLWSLAKKYNFTTDITGTPAGPGGAQVPTQPEPPVTPEVPAGTTVTFEDLGPGGDKAQNLVVQKLLAKHWGLDYSSGPGVWGDLTKAAYSRWQRSLGFSGSPAQPGSDADGLPGVTSMSRFAAKYGLTLKRRSDTPHAPTPPTTQPKPPATGGAPAATAYLTVPEEAHDYRRVSYGGRTVNVRTRELLKLAEAWCGVKFSITQGSYNKGVSASAGTHDGGGVVDISVSGISSSKRTAMVVALRKAGFAAWLRTPAQGFSYHIHACAIGDKEMAGGAKNQVQSYFNGRNGLANNGRDDAPRHWPDWADKYNQ